MECSNFIGLDYEPAAAGENGKIDCIWLVYKVLSILDVPTPPFNWEWYKNDYRLIYRSLLQWGRRVSSSLMDGDVLVLPDDNWAFAVVWHGGFLHIHPKTKKVAWSPLGALQEHKAFRYCHSSGN